MIGPVQQSSDVVAKCLLVSVTPSIEKLIGRFWKIEEPEETPFIFLDESRCEATFQPETTIDNSGRYRVPFPFHQEYSCSKFGDMQEIVLK